MQLNLSAPTTTELRRLATEVDQFTRRLIRAPLASPGTLDLSHANDARHEILDRLTDLHQSLESEIAKRRPGCCLECHATEEEWGRFEAGREDHLSDLNRVLIAERTGLNRGVDPEIWHSFSPGREAETHPVGCGAPTEELAALAMGWDADGRTA